MSEQGSDKMFGFYSCHTQNICLIGESSGHVLCSAELKALCQMIFLLASNKQLLQLINLNIPLMFLTFVFLHHVF